MFRFLEYFFNFSIVVLRRKSNRRLLKTMAIFLNFVVKTALVWLVLGGFFWVFSQSQSICNLHSCYKFALALQRNCTLFSANQNWVIFSCILLKVEHLANVVDKGSYIRTRWSPTSGCNKKDWQKKRGPEGDWTPSLTYGKSAIPFPKTSANLS